MREATVERNTTETQIAGFLRIEGSGLYQISTGIRFLDHMLELFAKHGAFDLNLSARGDLDVLAERGQRVLRVHLKDEKAGLKTLTDLLSAA